MKPRTLLLVITLFVIEITLNAQIPYFSGTAGMVISMAIPH